MVVDVDVGFVFGSIVEDDDEQDGAANAATDDNDDVANSRLMSSTERRRWWLQGRGTIIRPSAQGSPHAQVEIVIVADKYLGVLVHRSVVR